MNQSISRKIWEICQDYCYGNNHIDYDTIRTLIHNEGYPTSTIDYILKHMQVHSYIRLNDNDITVAYKKGFFE